MANVVANYYFFRFWFGPTSNRVASA